MDHTNIFYNSKEFFHKNTHYPPGWYFFDEEQYPYGPFVDKAHCERGLIIYIQQLMDGVAPTQIGNVPNLTEH